ncbi:MAG: hypothetical protein P4L95_07275 [Rouxiella aceris]|uniref:hypothetical protein n=1 Tax=Rouxiella aceris TaxID=2703884 RepID=UPI00284E39AD|nr:hypothetical protein [Rouxiella aceris]MDR3431692.1 hypothetical protein [Rouxiella aceris]
MIEYSFSFFLIGATIPNLIVIAFSYWDHVAKGTEFISDWSVFLGIINISAFVGVLVGMLLGSYSFYLKTKQYKGGF